MIDLLRTRMRNLAMRSSDKIRVATERYELHVIDHGHVLVELWPFRMANRQTIQSGLTLLVVILVIGIASIESNRRYTIDYQKIHCQFDAATFLPPINCTINKLNQTYTSFSVETIVRPNATIQSLQVSTDYALLIPYDRIILFWHYIYIYIDSRYGTFQQWQNDQTILGFTKFDHWCMSIFAWWLRIVSPRCICWRFSPIFQFAASLPLSGNAKFDAQVKFQSVFAYKSISGTFVFEKLPLRWQSLFAHSGQRSIHFWCPFTHKERDGTVSGDCTSATVDEYNAYFVCTGQINQINQHF